MTPTGRFVRINALALLLITIGFTACATVQPPGIPAYPGQEFTRGTLTFRAPDSDGWYKVPLHPSAERILFVRYGNELEETFAAEINFFPMGDTNDIDAFIAQVKEGIKADTDIGRHDILKSEIAYTEDRGYPCALWDGESRDRQAVSQRGGTTTLLLQMSGLYCRHPENSESGFAVMYSHRGYRRHVDFITEAREFQSGVRILE